MTRFDGLGRVKRLIPSVSLANLLALQVWTALFLPGVDLPSTGMSALAAMAAVLVLGLLIWLGALLVDRIGSVPVKSVALGMLWSWVLWVVAKPGLQEWLQHRLGIVGRGTGAIPVIVVSVALVGLWLCIRHAAPLARWLGRLAWVFSPFVAVTFLHAGSQAWSYGIAPPGHVDAAAARLETGEKKVRTVVVLFDEFDYELAFDPQARAAPLPALDRLRQESFFATHAYSPMHFTAMSVPALLTGQLVSSTRYRRERAGDLLLELAPGQFGAFSEQQTVFSLLRQQGFDSIRLSHVLLPPWRLEGSGDADVSVPAHVYRMQGLRDQIAGHLLNICSTVPFARTAGLDRMVAEALGIPDPSKDVAAVADQVVDLAVNGKADFLFLHILLPHLPVVVDAKTGEFAQVSSIDYRNNLIGVDRVVARIRDGLVRAGRWNDTALVVTSDHFFRNKREFFGLGDHRIPFIVKLRGERAVGAVYDASFNTVVLKGIVEQLVTRPALSSAELAAWMDAHSTVRGESPLSSYRKGW